MMTTRVQQLSDGEELVTIGNESQPDRNPDPRDRILGYRTGALAVEPRIPLSGEGWTRSQAKRDA
jgi:hypothetical protein